MSSQSKETVIPANQLTCLDLWTLLPFHDELTVDDGIARNKYIAESAIPENELTLPDLWAELPFQTHLTEDPSSKAANKSAHANARSGAGDVILRAVDNLPAELRKAVAHAICYRNATGEKEVEKWKEKDNVWKAVEQDRDASMMALGMEKKGFAHDLVVMAVKAGTKQDVDWADGERSQAVPGSGELAGNARDDNRRTADDLGSRYRPHSSNHSTTGAIQNPGFRPIRTVSQWDPGPEELDDAIPATKAGRDPVTTLSPEAMDPATKVNQDHWADSPGGGQRSSNWKHFRTWGKSHRRISGILMAEIGGRKIWDPGGKEVKFNSVVQSWRIGRMDSEAEARAASRGQRAQARRACREASMGVLRCTLEPQKGCG